MLPTASHFNFLWQLQGPSFPSQRKVTEEFLRKLRPLSARQWAQDRPHHVRPFPQKWLWMSRQQQQSIRLKHRAFCTLALCDCAGHRPTELAGQSSVPAAHGLLSPYSTKFECVSWDLVAITKQTPIQLQLKGGVYSEHYWTKSYKCCFMSLNLLRQDVDKAVKSWLWSRRKHACQEHNVKNLMLAKVAFKQEEEVVGTSYLFLSHKKKCLKLNIRNRHLNIGNQ